VKAFAIDVNTLQTVAAGVLDANGVLLEANAGFLRLLPDRGGTPMGVRAARYFIQPDFATLVRAVQGNAAEGYRGLMTIGDSAGKTRTLRGQVSGADNRLRVLAEYDIAELERLNESILALNRDSSVTQHALTQSNVSLTQSNVSLTQSNDSLGQSNDSLAQSNVTLTQANVTLTQREGQLVEASLTDALTGVGNRRKLEQALAIEISRVRRGGGSLSAIMADIDHFKRVNDVYGHGTGDKVLAHFGALLRSMTRPTDIVARFGGEEFFVLMPNTPLAQAAAKAEQLRSALAAERIEPLEEPITASFGAAELALDETGEALLKRVDTALYQAKEGGRNRVITAASTAQT